MLRETISSIERDDQVSDECRDGRHSDALEARASHRTEAKHGSDFPSTRYYGSKKKQLEWLREEFVRIKGNTILDAFGGTGAVSHLWRSLGWEVTYNDVFAFNTISARAIFSDSTRLHPESAVCEFLHEVKPVNGFISRTFDGLYFLPDENAWLDGLLGKLEEQDEAFRFLVLHCLFQACLQKRPFNLFHRANLHLRLSGGVVKFGNRTTWARPFAQLMLTAYREVARMQSSAMYLPVQVARPGPADAVPGNYDAVYIDPPYFHRARKTESYLQRYHFLEGLARYGEWPHLIDPQSPIGQIREGTVPEWASKKDFRKNLVGLIEKHKKSQVILSYVSDEFPSESDLIEIFRNNFDNVRVSRRSFSRALSKKKFFEILISGRP
ncbi:Adenine-specific DNA methylase [Burkholderia pseudomallei]|nr:Adenine-specific DNA methylase [Burkholderia pseudomallei]